MNRPIEIFFSYAHEDEAFKEDVRRQLVGYERRGIILKWHDRMITAGAEWHGEIDRRLRRSDVVLLFISPYFIDSDYAYDIEMAEALRRHDAGEARVLPIIVTPSAWQDEPFARLQVLPTDGRPMDTWPNRNEAALDVARGIMRVVRELSGANELTNA